MVLDQLPDVASETLGLCSVPGFSTDRGCPLWALCTTAACGRLFCGVPTSPEGWGGVAAGSNYPVLLLSEEKHETWNSTKAEWERE